MKSIRIENITKVYDLARPDERAVDDVSLMVEEGELFFLLGPSGCGKTTLLRMIAGLTWPTAGRIHLGDRDVTDVSVDKRNTALVFQNYALWPHMTVAQNVEFGPKMKGVAAAQRRATAGRVLSIVQMEGYVRRKPVQLSGGQQQRVALARALAAEPDCLLLDEPLSNLDAKLRLQMRSELRRLIKSTGATAVYVTHDQKEAMSMADRIAVMKDGRIQQIGTPRDVYDHPGDRFVADFLGEANFIEGRVAKTGATTVIDTAAGQLLVCVDDGPAAGATVTCCIRPERVTLQMGAAAASPETAALAATMVGVVFLGEMAQLTCRLANADVWKVTVLGKSASATPPEGAAVTLVVAGQHVVLV